MRDTKACAGCRDNFYNRSEAERCWSLKSAKMVKRFETGTWTDPTQPGAFTEVMVPSCYHAQGRHFVERLPDFVKIEDVNWLKPREKCALCEINVVSPPRRVYCSERCARLGNIRRSYDYEAKHHRDRLIELDAAYAALEQQIVDRKNQIRGTGAAS